MKSATRTNPDLASCTTNATGEFPSFQIGTNRGNSFDCPPEIAWSTTGLDESHRLQDTRQIISPKKLVPAKPMAPFQCQTNSLIAVLCEFFPESLLHLVASIPAIPSKNRGIDSPDSRRKFSGTTNLDSCRFSIRPPVGMDGIHQPHRLAVGPEWTQKCPQRFVGPESETDRLRYINRFMTNEGKTLSEKIATYIQNGFFNVAFIARTSQCVSRIDRAS